MKELVVRTGFGDLTFLPIRVTWLKKKERKEEEEEEKIIIIINR